MLEVSRNLIKIETNCCLQNLIQIRERLMYILNKLSYNINKTFALIIIFRSRGKNRSD